MDAWESVSSTYAEAVANSLPLHRAGIAVVGFMAAIGVGNQSHKSIAETIAKIRIQDLLSFDQPPIKGVTVAVLITAAVTATVAPLAAKLLLRLIFLIARRVTCLWERVEVQLRTTPFLSETIEHRQAVSSFVNSTLERPRATLRSYRSITEFSAGMSLIFLVAFFWGNEIDLALSLLFLVIWIVQTVLLIRYFLSSYFGSALLLSKIQGRSWPNPVNEN